MEPFASHYNGEQISGFITAENPMRRSQRIPLAAFLLFAFVLANDNSVVNSQEHTKIPAKDEFESDFGLTRVWKIHLQVAANDWKAMQPTGGGFPGGPPGGFPGAGGPGTRRGASRGLRRPAAHPRRVSEASACDRQKRNRECESR